MMVSDKLGKNVLTQGKDQASSFVLHKGSHWPGSLDDSFLICQRCQSVILSTDPTFASIFEEAA
jgi:hypothetical protein